MFPAYSLLLLLPLVAFAAACAPLILPIPVLAAALLLKASVLPLAAVAVAGASMLCISLFLLRPCY
jgi:hypothetical protein